jgi:hypothetical protein
MISFNSGCRFLLAMLILLLSLNVKAQKNEELFQVTLDSHEISQTVQSKLTRNQLETYTAKAVPRLFTRVTGLKINVSLESELKSQAINWLKYYKLVPNIVDGVRIGQKLVLNFNQSAIEKVLKKHNLSVWSLEDRPSIKLMASLVEKNAIFKLDHEALNYRVDYPLQSLLQSFALNVAFASANEPWFLAVSNQSRLLEIQQLMMVSQESLLLVVNFVKSAQREEVELRWQLYDKGAMQINHGSLVGSNVKSLFTEMMQQITEFLVQMNDLSRAENQKIMLKVSNLFSLKSLENLQDQLKTSIPNLSKIELQSLEADAVSFQIQMNAEWSTLIEYFDRLPSLQIIERDSEGKFILLMLNYDPDYLEKTLKSWVPELKHSDAFLEFTKTIN